MKMYFFFMVTKQKKRLFSQRNSGRRGGTGVAVKRCGELGGVELVCIFIESRPLGANHFSFLDTGFFCGRTGEQSWPGFEAPEITEAVG